MTRQDLSAIRAQLAGITPGPWRVEPVMEGKFAGIESCVYSPRGIHILLGSTDGEAGQAKTSDAAFIAAAPSTVAGLLAVVERVEALMADPEHYETQGPHDGYVSVENLRAAINGEGEADGP